MNLKKCLQRGDYKNAIKEMEHYFNEKAVYLHYYRDDTFEFKPIADLLIIPFPITYIHGASLNKCLSLMFNKYKSVPKHNGYFFRRNNKLIDLCYVDNDNPNNENMYYWTYYKENASLEEALSFFAKHKSIITKLYGTPIICLMGKSGVGKSTVGEKLKYRLKNDAHIVKSYTTREVRKDDVKDKDTHIFVDMIKYQSTPKSEILALYKSPLNYVSWTDVHSFERHKINIYAIDPKAFNHLYQLCNPQYCFGVYLDIDDDERRLRLHNRKDNFIDDEHLDKKYLDRGYMVINTKDKKPLNIANEILNTLLQV